MGWLTLILSSFKLGPMPATRTQKISAVLIVKNELHNLKQTLSQLKFCDEIVVVDSGSTDGTIEFAESQGCKVVQRPFDGYGPQKAYAVSLAKHDWIFSVDADEWVPDEMGQEILDLINDQARNLNGIYIRSQLVFLGRSFWIGRESAVCILRIFKKSEGTFDTALVHEKVRIKLNEIVFTRNRFRHYSYPSIRSYIDKMNRYTTYGAREALEKHPNRSGVCWAALFPFKFIQYYFLQLNVLNGWAGFCWSVLSTFAFFVKYLKLAELRKIERV